MSPAKPFEIFVAKIIPTPVMILILSALSIQLVLVPGIRAPDSRQSCSSPS